MALGKQAVGELAAEREYVHLVLQAAQVVQADIAVPKRVLVLPAAFGVPGVRLAVKKTLVLIPVVTDKSNILTLTVAVTAHLTQ